MKKTLFIILFFFTFVLNLNADNKIISISEGKSDAKINLIIYESLTCSHCANFHKKTYPLLKKDFIDTGLVNIEFRSFPLDMAAFNASKIAHCKNNGESKILHFLFENQDRWVKGETIEEFNINLEKILNNEKFDLNFKNCINDKNIEDYILEDRIEAVKKYKIDATPTLIIMGEKFEKPLTYKNIKKALEKLI